MDKRDELDLFDEDRSAKPVRKRGRGRRILAVTALLAAMAAVVYLTVIICTWLDQGTRNDHISAINPGPGTGDDAVNAAGRAVYSQEELDRRLRIAEEEAGSRALEQVRADLRSRLDAGDSLLDSLRPLFPDELVVYSDDQYRFAPINRELRMNDWKQENLSVLETGEYQYLQDGGNVISHKGIDVSQYQESIDWKKVAEDGVEFAFIRLAYRGYGTGRLVEDSRFEANIKGATSNGVKVGVYVFSQAVSEEEAIEEANFILERIAPYKVECPVVFDVETTRADGRMNRISVEDRTRCALAFCRTIENAGYRPMLYYNAEMGALKLNIEVLEQYDKWFAAYTDRFYYPYAYDVWQYSSTGSVAGIEGDVDLNLSFVPIWE